MAKKGKARVRICFVPGCRNPRWNASYAPRDSDLVEALEDVLCFDAATINGDRRHDNPNLLYRGSVVLMIDHSVALPVHLWDDSVIDESPLMPSDKIVEHCAFAALKGRDAAYERVFGGWRAQISDADLVRLRGWIPSRWERRAGDLDRIFRFLAKRPSRFAAVSLDLARLLK